ncbi:MAG: twin-arginine translocase TatA/TatE family subunit [Chloroflexi bacterium]|nr:twin-arginine translocase TatA/TatE family subunit [Chloroflexota bacterium]
MGALQPLHIILIVAIGLLVFGFKPLTNLGRGVGKMFSEFRAATKTPDGASKKSQPPEK